MPELFLELFPFTSGVLLAFFSLARKFPHWAMFLSIPGIGCAVSWMAGEWNHGPLTAAQAVVIDSSLVAVGWLVARAAIAVLRRWGQAA